MNEKNLVRKITGIGILTALTIILQIIANVLPTGTLSISLTLFPIALCAVLYGPLAGLFLGMVEGLMVLLSTGTEFFLAYNPVATVIMCLLKTGLAGLAAGFIMMPLRKKHPLVGSILASFSVPIINTGLFILGTFFIFSGAFNYSISGDYFVFILVGLIGVNFFIELAINGFLSPALYRIYQIVTTKMNVGASKEKEE